MKLSVPLFMLLAVLGGASNPVLAQDELKEAQALLDDGKFEEAAAKFEAVLEKDGKSLEARLGCARAYIGLDDVETANFHATKAETLDPKSVAAAELAGSTFRAIGENKAANRTDPTADYEYATESFRRAAALEPKNVSHQVNIAWLCTQTGNHAAAAAAWMNAAEIDPANTDYVAAGVQSYIRAGQADMALKTLDEMIGKAENPTSLMITKGHALRGASRGGEAIELYLAALTHKMLDRALIVEAARGIWNAYSEPLDLASIASAYEKWTQGAPKESEAWWFLGYTRQRENRFEDAIVAFTKQNELQGGSWPEAELRLGQCYTSLGKVAEAKQHIMAATKKPWNWAPPHDPVQSGKNLVGTLYNKQDFEGAIEVSEKLLLPIVGEGQQFQIYQDIGFFYREWGTQSQNSSDERGKAMSRFEKSKDFYEKAVAALDRGDETLTNTARAQIINDCGLIYHYHFENYSKAIEYYKRALKFDAGFGDAILNYGRVMNKLGKYQEAVDILEKGPKDRTDIQVELRNARAKLKKS